MAGPTPFEFVGMSGGSVLNRGEFTMTDVGGELVRMAVEHAADEPSKARRIAHLAIGVLAVVAVVLVLLMPVIVA